MQTIFFFMLFEIRKCFHRAGFLVRTSMLFFIFLNATSAAKVPLTHSKKVILKQYLESQVIVLHWLMAENGSRIHERTQVLNELEQITFAGPLLPAGCWKKANLKNLKNRVEPIILKAQCRIEHLKRQNSQWLPQFTDSSL